MEKTRNGFENEAVFNPAVIREGEYTHLFYRAVRKGNYSSIGYCKLEGPLKIIERNKKPLLYPERKYESQGIEDPRIVKIEDVYYMTYSVYDKVNVSGAYATSSNLSTFRKQKVITPRFTYDEYFHLIECCQNLNEKYLFHHKLFQEHGIARKLYVWDKNIMFFPKKINGKFALLHRIHPGIQIVYFDDFRELTPAFWKNYMINLENHIVMDPKFYYESSHIGGGCPPIETEFGWLLIYHATQNTPKGIVYHASAALLDLKDPTQVISRLSEPIISPTRKWEKEGVVNNVIFPSGTTVFDDTIYIYYGAADSRVAVASMKLDELIHELKK